MWLSFGKDKLPKIFIYCDEHAPFDCCPGQKDPISRISPSVA